MNSIQPCDHPPAPCHLPLAPWSGAKGLDVLRTFIDGYEVILGDEGAGHISCGVMIPGAGVMRDLEAAEVSGTLPKFGSLSIPVAPETLFRIRRWAESNGMKSIG